MWHEEITMFVGKHKKSWILKRISLSAMQLLENLEDVRRLKAYFKTLIYKYESFYSLKYNFTHVYYAYITLL